MHCNCKFTVKHWFAYRGSLNPWQYVWILSYLKCMTLQAEVFFYQSIYWRRTDTGGTAASAEDAVFWRGVIPITYPHCCHRWATCLGSLSCTNVHQRLFETRNTNCFFDTHASTTFLRIPDCSKCSPFTLGYGNKKNSPVPTVNANEHIVFRPL